MRSVIVALALLALLPSCGANGNGDGGTTGLGAGEYCSGSGSGNCASGLYCQYREEYGSHCPAPLECDVGGKCGKCTQPGTAIVKCVGGTPQEGEPCDPLEVRSNQVCREECSPSMCEPTCSCVNGRWSCGCDCWNIFPAQGDAGRPSCGTPPICCNPI
jgi:hypothetical protein